MQKLPDQHLKLDAGKVPMHLLPTIALTEVARVLAFRAEKHYPNGWREGMGYEYLLCHMSAFARGEDINPESGLPHLAHASCCVLMLLEFECTGTGIDDRYIYDSDNNE